MEIAEAKNQSAHAEAIAKGFDAQIAESNAKAKSAEATAESERLARVRIEDTLSGWKLDGAAQARILAKVKPYPNTPFDLAVNPSENVFMETIDGLLRSAGWARQLPKADNPLIQSLLNGKASIWYGSGVHIEFSASRAKDFVAPAEALLKALRTEGIPAKGAVVTQGSEPNAIHIVIGKRE